MLTTFLLSNTFLCWNSNGVLECEQSKTIRGNEEILLLDHLSKETYIILPEELSLSPSPGKQIPSRRIRPPHHGLQTLKHRIRSTLLLVNHQHPILEFS